MTERAGSGEAALAGAGLVAVVALVLFRLSAGIDPPSLWLDDLWVALAVREMSWADFFELSPPVPLGFLALSKLCASLANDPEWPLQLVPVAAAVAQLPLLALLARRLSGSWLVGLAAAALLSAAPLASGYAVHVKQYSVDGLAVVSLLLVGYPLLDVWSRRRALRLCAAGLGALLFSFPSIFASFLLLHLAALRALSEDSAPRRELLGLVAVFDVGLLLVYFGLAGSQANAEMQNYWSDFYMPLSSGAAAWSFLGGALRRIAVGVLPNGTPPALLALLVPAMALLVWERTTRSLAVWLGLFMLEPLVASALGLYPFGTGRTDLFLFPAIVLALVLGVARGVAFISSGVGGRLAVALSALMALIFMGPPLGYRPPVEHARHVERVREEVSAGASAVLYPHASFAVAYYAGWPVELRAWDQYAHGFAVTFPAHDVVVLPGYSDLGAEIDTLRGDLVRLLPNPGERIVYYATDFDRRVHRGLRATLAGWGYAPAHREQGPAADLIVFRARAKHQESAR